AASRAAGMDRRGRRTVLLLPGRSDHERRRAARAHVDADRRGYRRGDGAAPVPVRHVQPDSEGDSCRRESDAEDRERSMSGKIEQMDVNPYLPEFMREAAAANARAPVSRRQFIKIAGFVGGGLVLGFSVATRAQAQE